MKLIVILIASVLAMATIVAVAPAIAGEPCNPAVQSCPEAVQRTAKAQDDAVADGPKWSVSRASCASASRAMDASMARCRAYDTAGGKNLAQCAKCWRQYRLGTRQQAACHEAFPAVYPPVNWAIANAVRKRLNGSW